MRESCAILKFSGVDRRREELPGVALIQNSPLDALGSHANSVRDLIIEVVRERHERSVEAHEVAATRYALGFASQWRDLLDDTRDAFKERGFASLKLSPAGYRLPIVNGCLLFVWRVPAEPDAVSRFASSKTRKNGFFSQPPLEMFGSSFVHGGENARDGVEQADFERVVQEAGANMPVVLVKVNSSPRKLSSIDWAVAEYVNGEVQLRGEETIWEPELADVGVDVGADSFDSGTPAMPIVEPRAQERPSDA